MHSAIHDPFAGTTPSQRLAAAARTMRLEKIAARAVPDSPISCARLPVTDIEQIPEPLSVGDWICRQKYLHPLPKAAWFSVEKDLGPVEPLRPTIGAIQRAVIAYYKIERADLLSVRRTKALVLARHVGMYLAKMLTLRTLPEIGRRFGRDHTSILFAVQKIAQLRTVNEALAADIDSITLSVGGRLA